MKIVSKRRDYYDTVNIGWHSDDDVTFVRHPVEIKEESLRSRLLDIIDKEHQIRDMATYLAIKKRSKPIAYLFIMPVCVLFCGKRYSGIATRLKYIDKESSQYEYWYDKGSLENYISELGIMDVYQKATKFSWSLAPSYIKQRIDNFFALSNELPDKDRDFLVENKITIAVYDCQTTSNEYLTINENLNDYQFYRVVDAFTAYQELDMWLGGILAYPPNFMVNVSDKDRIAAHGFDTKYGFRKRPAGRKK